MGGDNSQERRLAAIPNDPEGFLNLGDHCGLLTAKMEGRRRLRLERVGPYQVGRVIGRGNFATVRLARHEIAKTKVALKMVDKTAIDEENLLKVEREIRILKSIEHPHIIKLYEVIRTDRYIYIVTEYCSGGELYEVLIERGRTAEDEAKRWFGQASSALAYLHQRGVVHRDLKAENVLLDKNNNIKIIDFGFSNLQMPNQLLNTWCGSPPYAAPELLLGKEYDGLKADIWSLGVLLYILVTGGFPFPGDSVDKLKRAVLSGQVKIPYWVSVECADLIRKMLVLNPLKRFGINNVIQHRWMTNSQSTKTHLLVKNSLLTASSLLPERKLLKLNPTILLFMQQHGKWSEEQITEDVLKKNYDSAIFATYELLCDKVGRSTLEGPTDDHPRRGSRGSILSGKANVEPEPLTPTISAHHLAQLNLSTSPECESDDSSASDICDDSPSSLGRNKTSGRGQFSPAMNFDQGNRNEHRRHTLCASEQILSSDMMAQLPIGSPLHQAALNQATLAALAAHPGHTNPLFPTHLPFLPGLAPLPILDYSRMLPIPNNERRASAGENLLQLGTIDSLNHLVQPLASGNPTACTVEEEGQGYLNKYGGKRNTIHGVASPFGPSSPIPRHSPYAKASMTERRSSWASPTVTTQQQQQLERLYKQAIAGTNELLAIKALQKEFQQLGQIAHGCSPTTSRSPTHPFESTTALSSFGCPRISITDEHNRSLPPGSSTFDPINMFEHKANEVVFGQRPATVIGFASTSKSGTSSPEQTIKNMESRVKSYVSSLPLSRIVQELKNCLNQMMIQFEETNEIVYMDQEMRRLSLPTGIEIGCATLPPEQKSHVEFAIVGSDSPTSELLCEELISRLRILDTNSIMQ